MGLEWARYGVVKRLFRARIALKRLSFSRYEVSYLKVLLYLINYDGPDTSVENPHAAPQAHQL